MTLLVCASTYHSLAQTTYVLLGTRETSSTATNFDYYELYELGILDGTFSPLVRWSLADLSPDPPVPSVFSFNLGAFTYDTTTELFYLISWKGQLYSYSLATDTLTLLTDLDPNTTDINAMARRSFNHIEVYGVDSLYLGGSHCGFYDLRTGAFTRTWEYESISNNGDTEWGRLLPVDIIQYKEDTLAFTAGVTVDRGIGSYDRFNIPTPPEVLPNYVRYPTLPNLPNAMQYAISCDSMPVLLVQTTRIDGEWHVEILEVDMMTPVVRSITTYPTPRPNANRHNILDVYHIPSRTWLDCQVYIDLDRDDSTAPDIDYTRDTLCTTDGLTIADLDVEINNETPIDSLTITVTSPATGYQVALAPGNYLIADRATGATVISTGSSSDADFEAAVRSATIDVAGGTDSVVVSLQVWSSGRSGRVATAYLYIDADQLSAGDDQTITLCPDDGVQDLNTLVNPGGTWSADPIIDPATATSTDYLYTISSPCGVDTAIITVAIRPAAISIDIDTMLCVGESIEVAGQTYETPTTTSATIASVAGCDSIIYDIRIAYLPGPTTVLTDTSLCVGDTIVVDGTTIARDTTLETCILNTRGCDSIIVQTLVEVIEPSDYSITLGGDLCDGIAELGISPPVAATDVEWSVASLPTITVGGPYAATVTDGNGCTIELSAEVPNATTASLSGQVDYEFEVDTTFSPDITLDGGTIAWTPATGLSCTDCLSPEITVTGDITYMLTMTSTTGCVSTQEIRITVNRSVEPTLQPTLANVFSPVATDPLNRSFYLQSTTIDVYDMKIYDRWGSVVFVGTDLAAGDPSVGWHGDFSGQAAQIGVYVYQITYRDQGGETVQEVGTVTVLR